VNVRISVAYDERADATAIGFAEETAALPCSCGQHGRLRTVSRPLLGAARLLAFTAIALLSAGCGEIAGLGPTPPARRDAGTVLVPDAGTMSVPDAGPLHVFGGIVSSAPASVAPAGMFLAAGGFELGARTCSDAGTCVTGGIVP
jgi:hypothetical protein